MHLVFRTRIRVILLLVLIMTIGPSSFNAASGALNALNHDENQVFIPLVVRSYCPPQFFDNFEKVSSGWPVSDETNYSLGYLLGFQEHIRPTTIYSFRDVYAADLDGDGDNDPITVGGEMMGYQTWWENDGSGTFTQHDFSTIYNYHDAVHAIDLDGDTDFDVLSGTLPSWWENDGAGNFVERFLEDDTSDAITEIYAADVDNDLDLDILGAAERADEIIWWENDGSPSDGGWVKHIVKAGFSSATSVYSGDLDDDGDIDIVGAAGGDDQIAWWENDGSPSDGGWIEHIVRNNYDNAQDVKVIDLDQDGDEDIVGAAWLSQLISWWENDGSPADGGWIEHTIVSGFDGARAVEIDDLDRDGDLDVIGCAFDGFQIDWWENDGAQNFTRRKLSNFISGARAESAFAVDIDNDRDLDILGVAYSLNDFRWWENVSREYRIQAKSNLWFVGARPGVLITDASIQVDVRNPYAIEGTFGIIFGLSDDWTEFYTFEINSNEGYWLWQYSDSGGWTMLDNGSSVYINQGTTSNRLSVVRDGNQIKTYVNGNLLSTIQDLTYSGLRHVGLAVSSGNQADLDVRFDNFGVFPLHCEIPTQAVVESVSGIGLIPSDLMSSWDTRIIR